MGESNSLDQGAMSSLALGAIHVPAPAHVPLLRASLPLGTIQPPAECRYDKAMDWLGADGLVDALGNDRIGCCVPAAVLRLMQLWRCLAGGDRRKPTAAQAQALYQAWGGYDPADPATDRGTQTDIAFGRLCRDGYQWSDQMEIVPRWTVLEADGVAPDLRHVRLGIYALGAVLATFRMPQLAMLNPTLWAAPPPGTAEAEFVGAHEVLVCGYDHMGNFYGTSWGQPVAIRPSFMVSRLLQASAFASDAWLDARTGRTPSGLDRDQIRAIGAQIQGT